MGTTRASGPRAPAHGAGLFPPADLLARLAADCRSLAREGTARGGLGARTPARPHPAAARSGLARSFVQRVMAVRQCARLLRSRPRIRRSPPRRRAPGRDRRRPPGVRGRSASRAPDRPLEGTAYVTRTWNPCTMAGYPLIATSIGFIRTTGRLRGIRDVSPPASPDRGSCCERAVPAAVPLRSCGARPPRCSLAAASRPLPSP